MMEYDPVDDDIDYALDLIERMGMAILRVVFPFVIGIVMGYAWRMLQGV